MKFAATVEISNGQINGCLVPGLKQRPVKGVVELKNSTITLSTPTKLNSHSFPVSGIVQTLSSFLNEGKLTLVIRDPQINFMIRDAQVDELRAFLDELKPKEEPVAGPSRKRTVSGNPSANDCDTKRNKVSSTGEKKAKKKTPLIIEIIRPKSSSGIKMATRKEIGKLLNSRLLKLVIKSRGDYPKVFPAGIRELFTNDMMLKKVDTRWLALNNLKTLNIGNNRINSVESLAKIEARLNTLILDSNPIGNISDDLFTSRPLASLSVLSLKNTEMTRMPRSILKLSRLEFLDMSYNKLPALPYNMHFMKSLQRLNLKGNQLYFLPESIYDLELIHLDMSENLFRRQERVPFLPWEQRSLQVVGTTLGASPLVDLAAQALANHPYFKNIYFKAKRNRVVSNWLPKPCIDAIENLHVCFHCEKMVANHAFTYDTHITSPASTTVRDARVGSRFDKKTARCFRCFRLVDSPFGY